MEDLRQTKEGKKSSTNAAGKCETSSSVVKDETKKGKKSSTNAAGKCKTSSSVVKNETKKGKKSSTNAAGKGETSSSVDKDKTKKRERDVTFGKQHQNMEELRLAAEAYYKNSSSDFQISATKFFESMDTNRDDRVSFHEFTEFLQQNGYNWVNPGMFSQLDTNKDGGLDFWEFLTFYYIVKTRFVHCKGCSAQLHGLHFTCVTCFDSGGDTFDLCARCYGRKQFRHDHKLFLDNYVLLRTKKGISPKMNVNQALTQPRTSHGSSLNRLFQVLEVAITLGSFLGGCSIM